MDDSSSGHVLKTRAEQERIAAFLQDQTRRSNSNEKKSRHSSSTSRSRHHRHPLDPVESDSDSERRSRHRSSKHRRSHSRSRSSSSGSERKHRRRREHEKYEESTQHRRRQRRHSSDSASRSPIRDRKRRVSTEKNVAKPTSTIIMRNIPPSFTEHELLTELSISKVPVQEIRLSSRRDPTTHFQTAYIEFNTVEEAEQWMTLTQGTFLLNGHPVTLSQRYDDESSSSSISHNGQHHQQRNLINELRLRDWDCYKCGVQNFKRRDHCFNCHISREDSERTRDLDGFSFVGLNPCSTLVLRGLDILTSKETIEQKLYELTLVPMKNCAIVKDNYTGVSRGFAFVEFNSIHDSVLVYEKLQTTTPGIEIEGKAVIVHFSKNNFATSLAQTQNDDDDFYARRSSSSRPRHRHEQDHDRTPSNVAQLLPSNDVDRTNTAAEIAQQALQNIHAQKNREMNSHHRRRHSSSDGSDDSSSNPSSKRSRATKAEQYTTPDPSKFEWFADIGFHYDKTTGFYFDAKSTCFYNPQTQKYMYWDPAQSNYIPVEDVAPASNATATTTTATTAKVNEKAEKAKQVAKEMELWAKREREKKEKEAKRKAQTTGSNNSSASTSSSNAQETNANSNSNASNFAEVGLPSVRPAGGLITLNLSSSSSSSSTHPTPTAAAAAVVAARPALLAAFDNPESDNDDSEASSHSTTQPKTNSSTNVLDASEEKLVDWANLTCLLCQREFDTRAILEKHLQMSNLHKENLAKAGIVRSQPLVYRDRAKERREKYGIDDSAKRDDHSPVHERSHSSTGSRYTPSFLPSASSTSSIGSKLMKKHGWQEGRGLGRKLQGRADPLQAEMRQRGLGLGAEQNLHYQAEPGDSYKDIVRKVARARFSMMES